MDPQADYWMQALRLAAIVEGSEDAILSKNADGIVTSWNAAAERMFGYAAADVVGRSIRILVPAERQREEDEVLQRVRRGERVEHFETVRIRRDGEPIDVSATVSPMRTADGRIIGASTILRDISERKRSERALAEGRAEQSDLRRRLRTIIDASGRLLLSPRIEDVLPAILTVAKEVLTADALAVWRVEDGMWRIAASEGLSSRFVEEALERIEERERILDGMLVVESVADEPRLAHRRALYESDRIESLLVVPLHANPDTQASIAFYSRKPYRFSEVERESAAGLGRLASAVIATAQLYDAQRRSRFESEFLAEAGAILMGSLDSSEAVRRLADRMVPQLADWCVFHLRTEEDGLTTVAAAAAGEWTLDRALVDCLLRADASESPEVFSVDRIARTGVAALVPAWTSETLRGAADSRHAAGAALAVRSLMAVPLVVHGRVLGVLTLGARQRANPFGTSELRFAQELAYRAALSIDNMLSYEEARRANRLKDEFLATLSHELRTPLNAILGYAQMLKKRAVPEERMDRAYEVLYKNARSLTQMVEDVLDISRIVSGKIRLQLQPVSLAPILVQSIETVQPGADAKGVRLRFDPVEDGPQVAGDADRLQQVFWNLLSNAVKFTPRNGVVTVRVARRDNGCEVAVSDNGAGIDPRFLPHLFERFRQADSRVAREHGGLGLGLAIARQLVEMHGGTITAESAGLGQGATFRVILPAIASR